MSIENTTGETQKDQLHTIDDITDPFFLMIRQFIAVKMEIFYHWSNRAYEFHERQQYSQYLKYLKWKNRLIQKGLNPENHFYGWTGRPYPDEVPVNKNSKEKPTISLNDEVD